MKKFTEWIKNEIKNLFSRENKIFSYLEKKDELLEDIIKKLEKERGSAIFLREYSTYLKVEDLKEEEYKGISTFPRGITIFQSSSRNPYQIILNEKILNNTEDTKLTIAHELYGHVDSLGKNFCPLMQQLVGKKEKIIKIIEKDEGKQLLKEIIRHYITFGGLNEAYAHLMEMLIGLFNSLKKGKSVKIVAKRFADFASFLLHEEAIDKETYEELIDETIDEEAYKEIVEKEIEELIKMLIEKREKEAEHLLCYLSHIRGAAFLLKMDKEKGAYLNNFLINYLEGKSFSYNEIKELILKLWEYKEEIEKEVDIHLKDYITYLKKFNSLINKILE